MKNIVLIGMSGVGKSEKGKYIATSLGWNFIDTDELIVDREKISIDDIFSRYGEEYFRNIEMKIIEEVSKLSNTVIATGGGIVTRNKNIIYLSKNGYIFLFLGKIQTIVNNINQSNVVRPLLKDNYDLYNSVEKLFKSREELYLSSSDIIIDVEDKSMEEVKNEVLESYEKLKKLG